jgi:phospholipid/cholesterol/gamma-HCH transport system permease protein
MQGGEGIALLGGAARDLVLGLGRLIRLGWQTVRAVFHRPFPRRELMDQMRAVGVASVPIALVTAVFVGAVMALQFGYGLRRFGAGLYTGSLVSLAYVMELGPVLTSILVGGRVGAGITAELGSMKVSEQIDAIRVLGSDPVRVLVMPRVLACLLAVPVLVLFADVVGILGGMMVNSSSEGVSGRYYLDLALSALSIGALLHGLIKSLVFGFLIGLIACHRGFQTGFGTEGVGRATTETVVQTSIIILATDLMLTRALLPLTDVFNQTVRYLF